MERLKNETTRLPVVKAFLRIAESPLQLKLSSVQQELVSELLSYLQKANRTLKQASLDTLDVGSTHPSRPTVILYVFGPSDCNIRPDKSSCQS